MNDLIRTTDDKLMMYKAINSSSAIQMKDVIGTELVIKDVIQVEVVNSSGELVVNTTIFAESGELYATLSPTISSSIHNMENVFGDLRGLRVVILDRLNPKSDRKFLTLDVV